MARPRKEINQRAFEQLCGIMCTEQEICSVLGVTDKTLNSWCKRTYGQGFSEANKNFSATGKMSLRRAQFELAQKNATMAIWLGKQYLGQKDMPTVNDTTQEDALAQLIDAIKGNKDESEASITETAGDTKLDSNG